MGLELQSSGIRVSMVLDATVEAAAWCSLGALCNHMRLGGNYIDLSEASALVLLESMYALR